MNVKELGALENNVLKLPPDLNRFSLNGVNLKKIKLDIETLYIDGTDLNNLDSAGIALLIYLKRIAKKNKKILIFQNMPEIFFKLSALYEVEFNG